MKLLLNWLVSFFTADRIGILMGKLLSAAGGAILKDLFDTENQKKAYEFVKELNQRTDLTCMEKAAMFNMKFAQWAKSGGKTIAESIINCLREMAVNAIKSETAKN